MTTLSLQVGSSGNDDWGSAAIGLVGGTVMYEGQYAGFNVRTYARFTNVTIPAGATASVVDYQTKAVDTDTTTTHDVYLHFNDVDDSAAPADGSALAALALTTAFTQSTNLSTTAGTWYTRAMVSAGQEVLDRGGWASGNDQTVLSVRNSGTASRRWTQYDNAAGDAPKLDYTYSSSIQAAVPAGTISLTGVAVTVRKSAPVVVGSVTFTGVTPTIPTAIQAAVVVGTVTFTGVTSDTRHSVPVVVGTVAITGVSPASTHQAAVSVGAITLTGVALTSVHYAAVSVGAIALAGVVPGSTHRAAVVVGSAVFTGVSPGSTHSAAVSVGSVVFGFGIHVASIQDVNFNGSTSGGVFVSFGAGMGLLTCDPIGDDLTGWQAEVDTLVSPASATVSLISGGFRITFNDTDYHPPITISIDTTNLGLTTITQTQIGGNYFPVSVRKDVGVSVGTFALTGVLPATRHRAAVEVGSVVFAGVTPTANYGIAVPGPFIAVAWANWQPGDVAGDSYQPGDKAGTNL